MKKILCGLLIFIILATPIAATTTSEAYIPSETEVNFLDDKINFYQERKDNAHRMAEAARELGFNDDSTIIQTAKSEWDKANEKYLYYQSFVDRFQEYPVATIVWLYLKDMDYNDELCAGILGNMMVECGGLTLDLDPYIYAGYYYNYYGLCMWYGPYNPDIYDLTLIEQLDYLANNIQIEVDTFGYMYYQGFNYKAFLTITDVSAAAMAFCKTYERCYSDSYPHRIVCAAEAYDYFAG